MSREWFLGGHHLATHGDEVRSGSASGGRIVVSNRSRQQQLFTPGPRNLERTMSTPLVSVIILTFNRAYCVGQAIDSVRSQTHRNTEILVLDVGSTDGTRDLIEQSHAGDARVRYFLHENRGVTATRNRRISLCRGDFVALLDSDDLWSLWKLELQLACLRHHPEIGTVWTDMEAFGPGGEVVSRSYLRTMYSAYQWFPRKAQLFPKSFALAEIAPALGPVVKGQRFYTGQIFSQMIMGNLRAHVDHAHPPGAAREGPRVQRGASRLGRGLRFPPADVPGGPRGVHRPGDDPLPDGNGGSADARRMYDPYGDELFANRPSSDRKRAASDRPIGSDDPVPTGGDAYLGGRHAAEYGRSVAGAGASAKIAQAPALAAQCLESAGTGLAAGQYPPASQAVGPRAQAQASRTPERGHRRRQRRLKRALCGRCGGQSAEVCLSPDPSSAPIIPEKLGATTPANSMHAPKVIASDCKAHLITDAAQLDELETEWAALFDIAPTASPPLLWEWVREWWRIYGPVYGDLGRGLRLITVRRGSDLIGVLPLYLRSTRIPWGARQLRFVSTGEAEFEGTYADYLDLLHAPGAAGECVAVIGRTLMDDQSLRWDQLDLSAMSARSPLLALQETLGAFGFRTTVTRSGVCYISNLSGGFEAYLNRLSRGARGEARKLLRDVNRSAMVFECAGTAEEADRYFDQMVELHRNRWESVGKAGTFSSHHAEFHRTLARTLVPSGKAVLARLSFEGSAYAVTYGHLAGDTYYCYQRGVRMANFPVRSPGTATILLLMAHLTRHGTRRYDHLAGASLFKKKFATDEHSLADMRIAKPNFRYLSSTTGDLLRRATSKAALLIKKALPGGQPPLS
jgi:CelD/BcsL family acetyltransferase involved in cellulose biosynthesis